MREEEKPKIKSFQLPDGRIKTTFHEPWIKGYRPWFKVKIT